MLGCGAAAADRLAAVPQCAPLPIIWYLLLVVYLVILVFFATQDIILCDWFAELPAAAKLRCTYSYMASQQQLPPGQYQLPHGPAFALERHHELLSVLMQLFVALSRANRSVIILENR